MDKIDKIIKDITKLRQNVNVNKYYDLNLKDNGDLLYEKFNNSWKNDVIYNELLKYKNNLKKIQK